MLNKIIHFSLNNRIYILFAALALLIGGSYTASRMEVDVFPDLNAPTVVVMTEANGMAPEEVEQLVTFPIETAVNGSTGVRRVRSSSTTGFSVVWVEFDWNTDIYLARQIVSEKVAMIRETLPQGVGSPTLGPQSSILGEVLFVGLTADSTSMADLRTLADWEIRPRLLSTGGVAQVSVLGGDIKEYQILLSPERMRYYGVSLLSVADAVEQMNKNASGGVLYEYGNEYIIRGMASTTSLKEMGKALVGRMPSGSPITLHQIAEVKIGEKTPKMGVASVNGKPAVLLTVTKQPNMGTLELTEKLDKALVDMQGNLPADVKVNTQLYRQQSFIDSSISNIKKSLFEGAIFVVLVLFVFLMNTRTTVISLVTIPLALLVSVITLKMMGLTINTMSIGGMAIAIGSLVDDAIVDVENVFRHIKANNALPESERRSVLEVVKDASAEVRMPILNSTLIIVASFLPLFFLSGMEGRMLEPLGIAFIVSLFASTLVALTLTPVLCSFLLKDAGKKEVDEAKEPHLVTALKAAYLKALEWTIGKPKRVLATVGVAVVATLIVFFNLGRSFLPPFNEGSFTIGLSTLPGVSLEESDRLGKMAEDLLLQVPEIQAVARKTGRAELDEHALGVNTSEMEAPFVLTNRSKEEVAHEVREKLETLPGVNIEVGQPISHRIDAMLSGTRANIAIKIFGPDLNRLYSLGNRVKSAIADVEGVADLNVEQQVERPQLKIVPNRDLLAKFGITMAEFNRSVGLLLGGETVSTVFEGNRSFDLTLRVEDHHRQSAESVRHLLIDTPDGRMIPLEYVAEVKSSAGPNTISRENVSRKLVVSANVEDRDLRSTVKDISRRIKSEVDLPDGYHIEYGGQFESEEAASRTLMITTMGALLVIFLLLRQQFKSARQAGTVLLNLPLALIGGVMAIGLTSGQLSIPATIGFISLFGVATRNGMLLIDHYNNLSKLGLTPLECVMQGSADRLNPIIMTALTSALALIPLAVAGELPGNEIQSPMAKVMLGGLVTSTLLNAFVIPIMYLLTDKSKNSILNKE